MDKIAIDFTEDGDINEETRKALVKFRSHLRSKITLWDRGLRIGRLPNSEEYDKLVDELYQVDGYLTLTDDDRETKKTESYDSKLTMDRSDSNPIVFDQSG